MENTTLRENPQHFPHFHRSCKKPVDIERKDVWLKLWMDKVEFVVGKWAEKRGEVKQQCTYHLAVSAGITLRT